MVARAGADAIGLNFYAESPRCISRQCAAEIAAAVPPEVVKVGLFVDAQAREVCAVFDNLGLNLIQLHGAEPPDFLRRLGDRPVMRAFPPRAGRAGADCSLPGRVPFAGLPPAPRAAGCFRAGSARRHGKRRRLARRGTVPCPAGHPPYGASRWTNARERGRGHPCHGCRGGRHGKRSGIKPWPERRGLRRRLYPKCSSGAKPECMIVIVIILRDS